MTGTTGAWRRGAVAAAVLALAACTEGGGPAVESCRAKAYDDPAVQDATERSISKFQQISVPAREERDRLVQRFVQQCLAGKGLAPRGGVEPVNPP